MSHLNVNKETSDTKDLRLQSLFFPSNSEMDMKREYSYYAPHGFYARKSIHNLLWIKM